MQIRKVLEIIRRRLTVMTEGYSSPVESIVNHKFREKMILPYVAISNGLDFMLTSGERWVTTADGIHAKVVHAEEKHICELEEDIQEIYGIDAWRFVKRWYLSHKNMDSMYFLVIKLKN